MIRPRLHPPRPTMRVDNDLLLRSSVSYPPRDRVDSLSSTLGRRRNMGELDRRSRIGVVRLTTAQRNAENQQKRQPQDNWDQQSQLRVAPRRGCDSDRVCRAVVISDRDKKPRSLVCLAHSTHILLVTASGNTGRHRRKKPARETTRCQGQCGSAGLQGTRSSYPKAEARRYCIFLVVVGAEPIRIPSQTLRIAA